MMGETGRPRNSDSRRDHYSDDALLLTSLTNDGRGGRDALYPGSPPTDCPSDCDASGAVAIGERGRGA